MEKVQRIIIIFLSCLTSLDRTSPVQKGISVNHKALTLLLHGCNNISRNEDADAKGSTHESNKNSQVRSHPATDPLENNSRNPAKKQKSV